MAVGLKDAAKLFGISIITFCAVFVCSMFLNYNIDITAVKDQILPGPAMSLYDAMVSTAKIVSIVSGGCLLITSVTMLFFYIKHYIDTHKKELGILKALGYSNLRIAVNFWVFGISVFFGAALGFGGAFIIMPLFYETQNADKILPDISVHFHITLLLCMVILPTAVFSLLSMAYACLKLKRPVLGLLKETAQPVSKYEDKKVRRMESLPFLLEMKKSTLRSRKTLVFFMIFSAFCYSSMTQMSGSMNELASDMMGIMMLVIGVVLAFTTLFIAVVTIMKGNTKTIALMRLFGYSQKECCHAMLGGYRPLGYLGFVIGSVYQYVLLKIVVSVVFADIEGVPEFTFNFAAFGVSFVSFVVLYELIMYIYSEQIKKVSVKELMLE